MREVKAGDAVVEIAISSPGRKLIRLIACSGRSPSIKDKILFARYKSDYMYLDNVVERGLYKTRDFHIKHRIEEICDDEDQLPAKYQEIFKGLPMVIITEEELKKASKGIFVVSRERNKNEI